MKAREGPARSRPVLYRAIESETPAPSRRFNWRFDASAVLEQRADIGLRLAYRRFDLPEAESPPLRQRFARQRFGAFGSRGGAPGANGGGRAFERVGGVLPVLVGPGFAEPLDIDQRLATEEFAPPAPARARRACSGRDARDRRASRALCAPPRPTELQPIPPICLP